MSKKSLITGTLILTSANLVTRIIGFFYRVFMSNTIGMEGMGLYQLIMPIYMLVWSITSSGFTTTISKLTAQENAKKQYGNMGRVLKQSIFMCMTLSIFISIFLFSSADFISSEILKEARTFLSLQILAICLPFMSAGSCIRGYFFGLQNSVIPAISQILEQCVRIIVVFFLASIFIPLGLSYACAAAVIGIVVGEIISFAFVFLSYLNFKRKKGYMKQPSLSAKKTFLTIISMAIPLSASRVIGSLLSTAENILIPQRLQLFGQSGSDAMSTYGKLTGMAMPLIQFPSALLTAVSITLVPAISEASAVRNSKRIHSTISQALLFTSIIGIGTAGIFAVFPKEISIVVYNQSSLEPLLFRLAFVCPFLYLQITLSGLLNGLGEHLFIFQNNIISSIINILFIYFFMPLYGVDAFIIGWCISLIVTSSQSLWKIAQCSSLKIDAINWFIKPILSISAAGLIVKYITRIVEPSRFIYVLCILLMYTIYILALLLSGSLEKEDILMFVKRKK